VGDQILIATGSRPAVPPIAGLDAVPYLTSDLLTADEDVALTTLPRSLVIIGGGYIALELAQMFVRFGTKVTLLQRSDRILSEYEPEVSIAVHAALAGEGIAIRTGSTIREVRSDDGGITVRVETRWARGVGGGRAAARRDRSRAQHRRPGSRAGGRAA